MNFFNKNYPHIGIRCKVQEREILQHCFTAGCTCTKITEITTIKYSLLQMQWRTVRYYSFFFPKQSQQKNRIRGSTRVCRFNWRQNKNHQLLHFFLVFSFSSLPKSITYRGLNERLTRLRHTYPKDETMRVIYEVYLF